MREWLGSFHIPVDDPFFLEWQQGAMFFCESFRDLEQVSEIATAVLVRPMVYQRLYLDYSLQGEFLPQFRKNMEAVRHFVAGLREKGGGGTMSKDRNRNQIIRKDARGCFVESLNDVFSIGKGHLTFVAYDLHSPAGQRQDGQHPHLPGYCRAAGALPEGGVGGASPGAAGQKSGTGDKDPLYQCMGGTSAERLRQLEKPRADGMSLSRVFQLLPGSRSDFLLVADSGPGERDAKGLIVPRFGKKPENHVTLSMTMESFCELLLLHQGPLPGLAFRRVRQG